MSNKIYRTALGKQVDMGALLLKNEDVRAVGNMGVNAKGDVLNKKNEIVATKAQQVNQQYRKQIRNQIVDVPVGTAVVVEEDTIEGFDTPLQRTEEFTPETKKTDKALKTAKSDEPKTKKGGLASAIAKAREVEQKKLKTTREEARSKKGVNKI
jgi:hypothetical protein